MNAQAVENEIAGDLESEMAKVITFRPKQEDELERLANFHRHATVKYTQRVADTKRSMKLKEAMFKADEKTELARHKAAMDLIAEQRATNQELGNRAISADEKLAAYNRAAVEALSE